jgi:valyl-tRNA synthetase
MDAIVSIRRAKVLVDMANQKIPQAYVKTDALNEKEKELAKPFIEKLAKVENVEFVEEKQENSVSDIGDKCEVFIPTDSIDLTPIINRLKKQDEKLQKEIDKLSNMLNNERFVANAPKDVLEKNRQGLSEAKEKQIKVKEQLQSLIK